MQPGTVINPNDSNEPQEPQTPNDAPAQSSSQPDSPQQPAPQPNVAKQQEETNTQETKEQFAATGFEDSQPVPEQVPPTEQPVTLPNEHVSWTASEYVAHEKNPLWYVALATAGAVVTVVVYVITQDIIATSVFPIVTLLFGVFAARKPEVLQYTIDNSGITIAQKHYEYENFKSFTVHDDSSLPSIFVMPTKRFMPGLTIYFPPDQANEIIDALSLYLPHEDREPDAVDRLMRRVRF